MTERVVNISARGMLLKVVVDMTKRETVYHQDDGSGTIS
jgi:hypothetical protein